MKSFFFNLLPGGFKSVQFKNTFLTPKGQFYAIRLISLVTCKPVLLLLLLLLLDKRNNITFKYLIHTYGTQVCLGWKTGNFLRPFWRTPALLNSLNSLLFYFCLLAVRWIEGWKGIVVEGKGWG